MSQEIEPSVKPEYGAPLERDDFDEIVEAYKKRRENFPGESIEQTLGLILFNLGGRYATVGCAGDHEWTSLKKDVPKGVGAPTCPEGHDIFILQKGMRLAWVDET